VKQRRDGPFLYVVRHGETLANSPTEEKFRSWNETLGINHHGAAQSRHAAEMLAPLGIAFLASSDLKRAMQTATIIGEKLGMPPQQDFALRDWNVGIYIGQSVKEFLPHVKKFEYEMPDTPIPKGEAYRTFYERFSNSLFGYIHAIETMGVSGAIVTHQRCIYALPNILTNGAAPIKWGGPPDPGGIVRLRPGAQFAELVEDGKVKYE
jgi:probable phosphoglycerate mutase